MDSVASGLAAYARGVGAATVGAYQICCSDESEKENMEAFHREVVQPLLPELDVFSGASFRTANLGARYEVGAISVAEDHYALPKDAASFKMMIVKLNSHVGVSEALGQRRYGIMERYGRESAACGALNALLGGSDLPFARELRATFNRGDIDRLRMLMDVPVEVRPLAAAVCAARLQAERLVADMRRYRPATPTVYTIAYGVTLNRFGADTELLCGMIEVDESGGEPGFSDDRVVDVGLGSNPSRYRLSHEGGRLRVRDT